MLISTPLLQTLDLMATSRGSTAMELKTLKKIVLSSTGLSRMEGAWVLAQYTRSWVKETMFHVRRGVAGRTGTLEGATNPNST